jgi:purine-binding chemotaxis protein CheW
VSSTLPSGDPTPVPAPEATDQARELHVLFRVGEAEYGLAARDVAQLESWAGGTPVPGTLPYVAGIVQVRGKVIPVVDLRVRLGLERAEATADSRLVVVAHGDRTVGLLVDSAREVVALDRARITPPPPLLATQTGGLVAGVAHLGPRMVLLLELAELLDHPLPAGTTGEDANG